MAAYYKVNVVLNSQAVSVGLPSPQSVSVTLPLVGPAGPQGAAGAAGATGAQGPQGVPGTGLEVLTTQGDLLYQGAATGERLPIGTNGQVLKVSGGIPAWGAESGAVSSVAGRTGAVTLAVADVADAVATSDARLSDARTPSSTLAHASTHHTGGTDAIAAHQLNGQTIFATGSSTYSTDQTLTASRALQLTVTNTNAGGITLTLPVASNGTLNGDTLVVFGGGVSGPITIRRANLLSPLIYGTLATITSTGQQFRFRAAGGDTGNWSLVPVDTHTHTGSQVNVGTTANLPLITGTNGVVEAGAFGTSAGTFCEGNDARLSDDRDPNLHAASHAAAGSDPVVDQDLNTTDSVEFNALKIYTAASPTVDKQVLVADDEGNILSITGNEADARASLGLGDAAVEDTTAFAASGSITSSGLTQATARILGRTTASSGSVEEIQIGSGLSLSAGELSSTVSAGIPATLLDAKGDLIVASAADTVARLAVGGTNGHVLTVDSAETLGVKWAAAAGGVSAVDATTADVLSVSGSDLVADDGGTIDSADPFIKWDDTAGKLVYANPLSRPSESAFFLGLAPTTTALGTRAINIQSRRAGATQVASGQDAVLVGNLSQASGNTTVAIGYARATATFATAIGNSNVTASAQGAVAIGECGNDAGASAVNAVAINNAASSLRAQFLTRPFSSVYWGGQTTNATPLILNLDATATNRFTIAASTALAVDIHLVARRSDTQDKWLVARRFLGIRRDGSNNTSLIGSVQTLGTDQSDGSPSWTFALTADDTNEALQLEVTGAASETIQWRATAFYRVA